MYNYFLQVANMKAKFPQFRYQDREYGYDFIGKLKPRETEYEVKIEYRKSNNPKVYVITPTITSKKHMYSDGSLCIYKKSEMNWKASKLVSHYVVPLTCMWLYFYEIFILTDVWYGPEAPHDGEKI